MEDTYILNATDKEVHTKAFGNHFTFKSGEVKRMSENMGSFIAEQKGYLGLVSVPESLSDHNIVVHEDKTMRYRETPEGQALLVSRKQAGIDKRVAFLTGQVHNLKVSIAEDLAGQEMKIDPFLLATKGDEEAMEELASYQNQAEDEIKARTERLKKLDRKLVSHSSAAAASKKA